MAGYIGSKAVITSGISATIDELNIIDGVTATTAELNIMDGVTSTAAELNILDGVTATTAELNIMDGVTATAAEINLIDGGTARGTTTIADGDGVLVNDAGTMRQTNVTTLATYMGTKIGGGMVFLASSGAISDGTASVAFTQFDASAYDHYKFFFQHVIPVTDGTYLLGQSSTDGGSSYDSTNGDYHFDGLTDLTGFPIHRSSNTLGSDANEFGLSGEFNLFAPHNTSSYTYGRANTVFMGQDGYVLGNSGGHDVSARLAAEDIDAIKFIFSSGNIESGEITMFGIVNS